MCDMNLWSTGKSQKQLRKNLKLLQILCDSVQSLHESCNIASKKSIKKLEMLQDSCSDCTESLNVCRVLRIFLSCFCLQIIDLHHTVTYKDSFYYKVIVLLHSPKNDFRQPTHFDDRLFTFSWQLSTKSATSVSILINVGSHFI